MGKQALVRRSLVRSTAAQVVLSRACCSFQSGGAFRSLSRPQCSDCLASRTASVISGERKASGISRLTWRSSQPSWAARSRKLAASPRRMRSSHPRLFTVALIRAGASWTDSSSAPVTLKRSTPRTRVRSIATVLQRSHPDQDRSPRAGFVDIRRLSRRPCRGSHSRPR